MQDPVVSMAFVPPSLPITDVERRTHIPIPCHLRHLDECAYDGALSSTIITIRSHMRNMSVKPS